MDNITLASMIQFCDSMSIATESYCRPYTIDEIHQHYGTHLAVRLLSDPVHKWRAETGIELIHKEPSIVELKRIHANWLTMSDKNKKISDEMSLKLFGLTNQDNYEKLILEYAND